MCKAHASSCICHSAALLAIAVLTHCQVSAAGSLAMPASGGTGKVLYAAHCGDSRAVLCRRGKPLRLTEDHKPNLPSEKQRIQAAGGRVEFSKCWRVICEPRAGRSGSGLAVSRSFGDLDFKEPHRSVIAFFPQAIAQVQMLLQQLSCLALRTVCHDRSLTVRQLAMAPCCQSGCLPCNLVVSSCMAKRHE